MTSSVSYPILYTFRRCPYAMRARMALCYAGMAVECREIDLKNKHADFLQTSPKGTVPVLVVDQQMILDESLDIVDYVCEHCPHLMADLHIPTHQQQYESLLSQLSDSFVVALHAVKYAEVADDHMSAIHHAQLQSYCQQLEKLLSQHDYLFGNGLGKADIVILPFIRQLSRINEELLDEYQVPLCKGWLERICGSSLFQCVMKKQPVWDVAQQPFIMNCC